MVERDMEQGLESLDYKEHIDYDIVASSNPAFNKAVVRLNIFKNHRQVYLCHRGQLSFSTKI